MRWQVSVSLDFSLSLLSSLSTSLLTSLDLSLGSNRCRKYSHQLFVLSSIYFSRSDGLSRPVRRVVSLTCLVGISICVGTAEETVRLLSIPSSQRASHRHLPSALPSISCPVTDLLSLFLSHQRPQAISTAADPFSRRDTDPFTPFSL
jgi:hypothetical protein